MSEQTKGVFAAACNWAYRNQKSIRQVVVAGCALVSTVHLGHHFVPKIVAVSPSPLSALGGCGLIAAYTYYAAYILIDYILVSHYQPEAWGYGLAVAWCMHYAYKLTAK